MADETIMNGVASDGDDRTVEIAGEDDLGEKDGNESGLMQKVAALEQEKHELVHENEAVKGRIKKLKEEIEALESDKMEMRRDIEKSEADKKLLEAVAVRAAELEAEVSRLQQDLVTAVTEAEEANVELLGLKRVVEELRKSDLEKGSKLEAIEKERNLLLEMIEKDTEGMKESRMESENRVRELEKKLEALELRESDQKGQRGKVEEETRARLDEKEGEIRKLKNLVAELESVVAGNRVEMERSDKEKEELEIVKNELEALLKKSERKVKEMEQTVGQLQRELEGAEKVIGGLKEKVVDGVNGMAVVMDRSLGEDEEDGLVGLKLQWPVVISSVAAVAAVGIVYLRFVRHL